MDICELRENAAKKIIEAVDFASLAGLNASDCGISLSASLYLNIRDAMFHFKALCDSSENMDNALKHYFNLNEHLIRGEKDAVISQVQAVCDAVYGIMQQKDFNDTFRNEEVKQLQSLMHRLKDVVLKLRIEGTKLSSDESAEPYSVLDAWEEVKIYTMKIVEICREKNVLLF